MDAEHYESFTRGTGHGRCLLMAVQFLAAMPQPPSLRQAIDLTVLTAQMSGSALLLASVLAGQRRVSTAVIVATSLPPISRLKRAASAARMAARRR